MAIIKKFRIKSFKKQNPILKIENVSLSFKKRPILDKISFNLNNGEILGLLGPNGVGKSTIFNLITGLLKPDFGIIKINNTNVLDFPIAERATKFKIGYVPQYGGYFHDLTLIENLKAIAEIQIEKPKDRNIKIDEIISRFEFDAVANLQAKFLSGGFKKKLVIALALLNDPKFLLLDEPFAALDVLTIKMLKELIVNLQFYKRISICICDHQAADLLSCVDSAIILSNCKVIAKGSPTELINDKNAKNAYFGDSFKI
jgi:lipopolysaccharide export system ATP-binding protein